MYNCFIDKCFISKSLVDMKFICNIFLRHNIDGILLKMALNINQSINKKVSVGIPVRISPSNFCSCPKPRPGLQTSYVVVFLHSGR